MQYLTFHRPDSISAVKSCLSSYPGAVILGGGMTVIPGVKQGTIRANCLVSLDGVSELSGIVDNGTHISIGAGVKHAAINEAEIVREKIPVLARLAGGIGDPGVRHQGTLGGAIAQGKLGTELSIAAVALDAIIETDQRKIRADEFCGESASIALAADEIILMVHFRIPVGAGYSKIRDQDSRAPRAAAFMAIFSNAIRLATARGTGQGFSVTIQSTLLDIDQMAMMVGQTQETKGEIGYDDQLVSVVTKRATIEARG